MVQGGTWVYGNETKMGGRMVKSRNTINETSPTGYASKWEILGEDGSSQAIFEGKNNKKS